MTFLPFLVLLLLASTTTSATKNWSSFKKLIGSHRGESPHGLLSVKLYLSTFGYLPKSKFNDTFDATFEKALMTYQKNFNLDRSGVLDSATIEQMIQPRCGYPDVFVQKTTIKGRKLYSYIGKPWPANKVLKYHFNSTGSKIQQNIVKGIFDEAFKRWSSVADLSFQMVSTKDKADIVLQFFSRDHGDGYPFDGQSGVLAHAFAPRDGRAHFDSDEFWAPNCTFLLETTDSFDLLTVAVHEIGHILGLGHSIFQFSVMFPTIASQTRKSTLSIDDKIGIISLYGMKPWFGIQD